MGEQDCGDFLSSFQELSSFELRIQIAHSKAEVAEILNWYDLPEEDFTRGFPDLAKKVQLLPD
jgi:hypothetical protein